MRIAHLSDLHILALEGVPTVRFLNKRLTGWLNLRFRRRAIHKPFAVRAAARAIRSLGVDHVVVTGDVSNLALETEFAKVRAFLCDELGMKAADVSLVPGNHDVYTGGAHRTKRFERTFADYLAGDLVLTTPPATFPFVRLRGDVAIIGLSSALPRPPFVASGALGREQLAALERILAHPDVRGRVPVLLQHHPLHNPRRRHHAFLEGLADADDERRVLSRIPRGLVLHGHLHRRIHRTLKTEVGHLDVVGATSASLLDESDERMAGFNLYDVGPSGISITSHRLVRGTETFREVSVPRIAA